MAASLGELFIELGVFADTKELKQFEQKLKQVNDKMKETGKKTENASGSLKKFSRGLLGFVGAISGAIYALDRMTNSLVANNQAFLNLTRTSDIALGTFQKWDNVGRMFGVKNAAQQIANLNQQLYKMKLTGEGAEGFMWAASQGIDVMNSDAEGIFEQLRERLKDIKDDNAAAFLLTQMGIDPTMLHLLRMTRAEFEAFNKETERYRLSEEQSQQLQHLNAQLEIAKIKIQYLKDQAVLALMPHLIRLFEVLADIGDKIKEVYDWLNNGSPISNFVKGLLKVIGVLTACIATAYAMVKVFEMIKMAILAVRAAMLLLSSHPIIAGLTLLASALMWGINAYQEANGNINGLPNTRGVDQAIDQRSYNRITNRNQQITMNNTIHTTEAAKSVQDELYYYQNYAFAGAY